MEDDWGHCFIGVCLKEIEHLSIEREARVVHWSGIQQKDISVLA